MLLRIWRTRLETACPLDPGAEVPLLPLLQEPVQPLLLDDAVQAGHPGVPLLRRGRTHPAQHGTRGHHHLARDSDPPVDLVVAHDHGAAPVQLAPLHRVPRLAAPHVVDLELPASLPALRPQHPHIHLVQWDDS